MDLTVEHGNGRGDGAPGTHGGLDLAADSEVVTPRQAVREDRALQGHHGTTGRKRVGDLGAAGDGG